MKKLALIFALPLATLQVEAATIALQSGSPNVEFKTSTGAALPLTGSVVLGFFKGYTTAMNPLIAESSDAVIAFIAQNFQPLGTNKTGGTADADHGALAAANPVRLLANATVGLAPTATGTIENSTWLAAGGAVVANSFQDGGLVRGTRLFLLAFNGPTLAESTELGVYSGSTWTIPTSALVNTSSLTLTAVDLSTEVYRGAVGSLITAPIGVIPEPSASVMALFAGLGMIARRRR